MTDRRAQLAIAALGAMLLVAGCTAAGQPADNPWGRMNVAVGVEDIHDLTTDRHVEMINESVDYWEGTGEKYRRYDVNFKVVEHADRPDVVVKFVPWSPDCGYTSPDIGSSIANRPPGHAGCAPVLSANDTAPNPVVIEVNARARDEIIQLAIKHEFGHVLGLNHSDEPRRVMDPEV